MAKFSIIFLTIAIMYEGIYDFKGSLV